VQSLLEAFKDISLRSASLIDEALFMVISKNLNFGTTLQVPSYQDFGIIGCLLKVTLLLLGYQAMSEAEFCFVQKQTYLFF
jgi:hypothetical protein